MNFNDGKTLNLLPPDHPQSYVKSRFFFEASLTAGKTSLVCDSKQLINDDFAPASEARLQRLGVDEPAYARDLHPVLCADYQRIASAARCDGLVTAGCIVLGRTPFGDAVVSWLAQTWSRSETEEQVATRLLVGVSNLDAGYSAYATDILVGAME